MRILVAALAALRRRVGIPARRTEAIPLAGVACTLGENPRWHGPTGALWWADLPAGTIYRWAGGGIDRWSVGSDIGALVVRASGAVLFGMGQSLHHFDPATGAVSPWCDVPGLDAARVLFNDALELPDGTLLVATKSRNGDDALGAIYRVSADGAVNVVARGFRIANGPAVDADADAVYVADSPQRVVFRASLAEVTRADTDAPATFVRFATLAAHDGFPDGMTVRDGTLWIAHYDGACLSGWSRDGRRLHHVPMPVRRPTAVVTGPESALFVTSASDGRGQGGSTYRVDLGGVGNGGIREGDVWMEMGEGDDTAR